MVIRDVVYVPRRAHAVNPQGHSRSFVIGLSVCLLNIIHADCFVTSGAKLYHCTASRFFFSVSHTPLYSQWPSTKPHRPTASHSQRRGTRRKMKQTRAAGRSRVVCHEETNTSSVCDTSPYTTTTPLPHTNRLPQSYQNSPSPTPNPPTRQSLSSTYSSASRPPSARAGSVSASPTASPSATTCTACPS
jgi:hypothetical protein